MDLCHLASTAALSPPIRSDSDSSIWGHGRPTDIDAGSACVTDRFALFSRIAEHSAFIQRVARGALSVPASEALRTFQDLPQLQHRANELNQLLQLASEEPKRASPHSLSTSSKYPAASNSSSGPSGLSYGGAKSDAAGTTFPQPRSSDSPTSAQWERMMDSSSYAGAAAYHHSPAFASTSPAHAIAGHPPPQSMPPSHVIAAQSPSHWQQYHHQHQQQYHHHMHQILPHIGATGTGSATASSSSSSSPLSVTHTISATSTINFGSGDQTHPGAGKHRPLSPPTTSANMPFHPSSSAPRMGANSLPASPKMRTTSSPCTSGPPSPVSGMCSPLGQGDLSDSERASDSVTSPNAPEQFYRSKRKIHKRKRKREDITATPKLTPEVEPPAPLSPAIDSSVGKKLSKKRKSDVFGDSPNGNNKKRRVEPHGTFCHICGTTDTPEWRRGPDGCKSLCNACGLYFAKMMKRERELGKVEATQTIKVNQLLN